MIKKSDFRGFTLIELLVVIAIIGVLSTVVLGSLNSARAKGADSSIKSNLANLRAQAEIVYDNTGSYSTLCTDTTVLRAVSSAMNAAGITTFSTATATPSSATTAVCHTPTGGASYAISVPLKSVAGRYACVDSTGNSTTTHALAASSFVCGS